MVRRNSVQHAHSVMMHPPPLMEEPSTSHMVHDDTRELLRLQLNRNLALMQRVMLEGRSVLQGAGRLASKLPLSATAPPTALSPDY